MKKEALFLGLILVACGFVTGAANEEMSRINEVVDTIHWLGQAAVRVDADETRVYIDPYKLEGGPSADLIFVTHGHADHCSPDDIMQILGDDTVIVAPADCASKLEKLKFAKLVTLKPGDSCKVRGIVLEAVPAYNVVKADFHPKDNSWVGYILTIGGVRVYHFGDTERVPEMKALECDIALLPLGQTYTMNSVDEAAAAVRDVNAKVAIPIHFGMYEGTVADAEKLKTLLAGEVEVVIKEHEKSGAED